MAKWQSWIKWGTLGLLILVFGWLLFYYYKRIIKADENEIKAKNKKLLYMLPPLVIALFVGICLCIRYWSEVSSFFEDYGKETYFGSYFSILCLYLIGAVIYFWRDSLNFMKNLRRIRKTYYTMYLILTAIGFITGHVDFRDWKVLAEFSALIVFIDLAIFQTPSINKIWSAEFQQEDSIRKIIEDNDKLIGYISNKIDAFGEVVDGTETYFAPITVPSNWDEHKNELQKYTDQYASKFNFDIAFFPFQSDPDFEVTKRNILSAMRNIETYHNFTFKDTVPKDSQEKDRIQIATDFANGKSYIMKQDKIISAPFNGKYSLIVTVSSGGYVAVNPVDGSHAVSLARITEWYLK